MEINENGEFIRYFEDKPRGMKSPIEQNNRHIDVLKKHIDEKEEQVPKRFGRKLKIEYRSIIMVSNNSIIKRPFCFGTLRIIKSDMVKTYLNKFDRANKNLVSKDKLREFSKKLAEGHQPAKIDYRNKLGLDEENFCGGDGCNIQISEGVVQFCSKHPEMFGDHVYCMECQKKFRNN